MWKAREDGRVCVRVCGRSRSYDQPPGVVLMRTVYGLWWKAGACCDHQAVLIFVSHS